MRQAVLRGIRLAARCALVAGLALGLGGCNLGLPGSAGADAAGAAAVAALPAEAAISVTSLDAPETAAPGDGEADAVAGLAAPEGTAPTGAAPDPVPVTEATADTPHPQPRPGTEADAEAAADSGAESAPETPPEPPKSQGQLLCEASGGVWGESADSGAFLCQKPTRDGGKACTKKTQCQGECLARSGTCAPVMPLLGCNDVLDGEGRMVTLCLD